MQIGRKFLTIHVLINICYMDTKTLTVDMKTEGLPVDIS